MKILFVCKYNRFRSKIAEALFLHYNKRRDIEVKSGGIIIDPIRPFVSKAVIDLLRDRGIRVLDNKSKLISAEVIVWANKIILVADDVPLDYFPPEKIYAWPIPDVHENDKISILLTMNKIEEYVRQFVKRLNI